MLRLSSAAAFTSLLALAPAALAEDSLSGTRGDIVEKSHAIDLLLTRGHAHMRVVREVKNLGERHDQALFHLMLPEGAVATGLRTRGTRNGQPVWYEGELLEAELAAKRYQELTGIGGYYPKDPALLSWRSQAHLALQVFPCPPKEEKGIGYDLELPTRWIDGREQLQIGAMGLASDFAVATLRTDVPGAKIYLEGREVPTGTRVTMDGARTIELQPPMAFGTVDARLGAVAFGPDRNLVSLRFAAPRKLAEVPRSASIVLAIDASRSLNPDDVTAEMRAGSAYLSHFEGRDAKVAIIAYDRHTRDLTPGFVGVREARAVLDGPALSRGNGSAVDEAVARAAMLLAKAPAGSAKRVVVLGDLLARDTLEPQKITPPKGAILHLATVMPATNAASLRDDEDDWSVLPRATGGVLFRAVIPIDDPGSPAASEEIEHAFLEWARPVRIDRVSWRAAGVERSDLEPELDTLEEGASIEHRALQAKLPANAILEGELWSKRFEKKVVASAAEGRLWSALVFGSDMVNELSDDEMNVLARAGRAVSPVTSYLAIEPGVRPSTEGLDESEGRGSGIGLGAMGTGHHFRVGTAGGRVAPDYRAIFASLIAPAVERCGAKGRSQIDAETTVAEVVDATVIVTGDSADRVLATCVSEAIWQLELPELFRPSRLGIHLSL